MTAPWRELAPRPGTDGFHLGGLCRQCRLDQHDEHHGQDSCGIEGCTCDEGSDELY